MAKRDPEPRLLTQTQAAAYCGLCVENFKAACPIPPLKLLDRIQRYDRAALDRWIDRLDRGSHNAGLVGEWRRGRNGSSREGH
jgi:hypothetical protein